MTPNTQAGPAEVGAGGGVAMPLPYGACCTWWDSMDRAGSLTFPPSKLTRGDGSQTENPGSSLPCCPHCKGALLQAESEQAWWAGVEAHAKLASEPEYPAFVRWMRGRCFASMESARSQYAREIGAQP